MGEHNCYVHDVHKCIEKKAHELWEKDGCQQGRDVEYWLLAEMHFHTHAKK